YPRTTHLKEAAIDSKDSLRAMKRQLHHQHPQIDCHNAAREANKRGAALAHQGRFREAAAAFDEA
ncbi:MAG: hypothetical protein VX090_04780, partial [Pseudomonadota bacterium]|nr:hypothetical protein [Pseudomonadota bacterium]